MTEHNTTVALAGSEMSKFLVESTVAMKGITIYFVLKSLYHEMSPDTLKAVKSLVKPVEHSALRRQKASERILHLCHSHYQSRWFTCIPYYLLMVFNTLRFHGAFRRMINSRNAIRTLLSDKEFQFYIWFLIDVRKFFRAIPAMWRFYFMSPISWWK